MKSLKKLAFIMAIFLCLAVTACGSDEEGGETDPAATEVAVYEGILTKVRLGMTESKVLSMLPDSVDPKYQDDYEIWAVDPDTNMQKIRDLLPADNLNYYADDSIITFYLKSRSGSPENILTGYMEEVHGLFPQDVSVQFYDDTIARLAAEYNLKPVGTMIGEKGIDETIELKQVFDGPSATITFTCIYSWQTVNDVDDYYGSSFSVKLMGKTIKEEVALDGGTFTAPATATSATEEGSESDTAEETTAAE